MTARPVNEPAPEMGAGLGVGLGLGLGLGFVPLAGSTRVSVL